MAKARAEGISSFIQTVSMSWRISGPLPQHRTQGPCTLQMGMIPEGQRRSDVFPSPWDGGLGEFQQHSPIAGSGRGGWGGVKGAGSGAAGLVW